MRLQILGLLRFSYPSVYNRRGEGDEAAYQAYRQSLYEPQRLRRRMVWFRHVVLPSLKNQSDQDFECVLLVGDQLPEPFKTELTEAVAEVPQIHICWEEEGQRHRLAVKKLMEGASDPSADLVAEMQLDDDDALGRHVMRDTRAMLPHMAALLEGNTWATLDFLKGLILQMDAAQHHLRAASCPLWTPGLMTFRRPDAPTIIRRVSHLELWQKMPVLSLATPLMYVRGAHEDNASNFSDRWERHCLEEDLGDPATLLQEEFGINLSAMQLARSLVG